MNQWPNACSTDILCFGSNIKQFLMKSIKNLSFVIIEIISKGF